MLFLALHLPLALAQEPPAWVAAEARYAVHVSANGAPTVEATYEFRPLRPGWFDGVLVGNALVIQSVSGPVVPTLDGLAVTLPPGTARVAVSLRGDLASAAQGEIDLPVLPAAIQRLEVDAPGFDVRTNAIDGYLHAADHLQIRLTPHQSTAPSAPSALVTAEVGTAFWEDEGSLAVRAEVHLRARRGSVNTAVLSVAGLDEVEVSGANVARWSRAGDLLTVVARAPVKGSWVLAISGRATPGGRVPWPQPQGVQRTDAWWVLGRSSDTELVPVSAPEGVPARAAPLWARGLAETAALAFFHGATPPELRADRFEPLMGPETVIEQADFRVGLNEDGRVLLRATYLVRNERKQYLHFTPPPGYVPVAARVGTRPVAVLSDQAGGIYVSLEKSLETVQGLVSFPLEVTWLATGRAWESKTRKGSTTLVLPGVDAPIQAADWTVHLPRGYLSLDKEEVEGGVSGGVVGGVLGGVAGGSASTEEVAKREEVQTTLDEAIQAYRKNDFDTAQTWVDQAKTIDASDANVNRMQSNLDVLAGKAKGKNGDEAMSRRVKDLANARTDETRNRQDEAYKMAKKAVASGDVSLAKQKLAEVVTTSNTLQAVEQSESLEQEDLREQANQMLAALGTRGEGVGGGEDEDQGGVPDTGAASAVAGDDLAASPPPPPPEKPVTESPPAQDSLRFDFEDISGNEVTVAASRPAPKTRGGGGSHRAPKGAKTPPEPTPEFEPVNSPAPVVAAAPAAIRVEDKRLLILDGKPAAEKHAAPTPSRAALSVHPTVLTLAMPEGGALLTRSVALLDPGEQPTLTLHYRSGDPG